MDAIKSKTKEYPQNYTYMRWRFFSLGHLYNKFFISINIRIECILWLERKKEILVVILFYKDYKVEQEEQVHVGQAILLKRNIGQVSNLKNNVV